jgi:PAS domain-containing protein
MKRIFIATAKILITAIAFYAIQLAFREFVIRPFVFNFKFNFLTVLKVGNFMFCLTIAAITYGLTRLQPPCKIEEPRRDKEPAENIQIDKLTKKLEEVLLEREELYNEVMCKRRVLRNVIDILPNTFIFAKTKEGVFFLANKRVAECYNVHPKDLIGKKDSDFTPSADELFVFHSDDMEVIETQKPKLGIIETITCWDRTLTLETAKYPLNDWNGDAGVLGVSFIIGVSK